MTAWTGAAALTLCRNLFADVVECAAADVRWRGRAEAVGRQVIRTCCFLHRPMGRDLRVGVRRGLQAVEDQRVHHSRHLAEAVALWCTAGRHNEFTRLDFLLLGPLTQFPFSAFLLLLPLKASPLLNSVARDVCK